MDYLAIHCIVSPVAPFSEILISQLGEIGFDMFEENEKGFSGYIITENYDEKKLKDVELLNANTFCTVQWNVEEIKTVNWNEEWEKNFEPVKVKNVFIRAPFHAQNKNAEIEIIIQPKMSFGTGHHATTAMIVQHILELDLKNKTVLDMGCGSGILGILAAMLGAKSVVGIDNDDICITNSMENIETNKIKTMHVELGDAKTLSGKSFDFIIANINRNILVSDIAHYAKAMNKNAVLVVSGFYEDDEKIITDEFSKHQLTKTKKLVKDNWCSLVFAL